jgi:hypothetical protein
MNILRGCRKISVELASSQFGWSSWLEAGPTAILPYKSKAYFLEASKIADPYSGGGCRYSGTVWKITKPD